MISNTPNLAELSDRDLVRTVHELAASERTATARLIASLAELDIRRLYLAEGCSSLFTYCTQVLHLSEHAAYGRIEAARATCTYPLLLERLETGALTLTAVGLLAPHLTPDNHRDLIDAARHKSKREIEQLVATLRPQPAVASIARKLPAPGSAPAAATTTVASREPEPSQRAVVKPLDAEQYKVQCTVSRQTFDKLRRVQELTRHSNPRGDIGIVFERAVAMLLEHLERTKLASVSRPRPSRGVKTGTRHIPAATRRAVWRRDNGQCAFVGTRGRCTERGFLEFHHVVPFADGGTADVANIELRCRAHNQYESDQWFGPPESELGPDRVDAAARR